VAAGAPNLRHLPICRGRATYSHPVDLPLPVSVRFALWFSGWLAGHASLDDARDRIVAADAAHDVVGLDGDSGTVPLIVALGRLRAAGATGAVPALPVPGDPLGLAGPASFNACALEVGEGVVLDGAGLGLVPGRTGAGVVWTCSTAEPVRQLPDLSEADTALRRAVLTTGEALADLDVARWRPEAADELGSLRRTQALDVPARMSPRALRLAALATRCRRVVELALADDGGSVSAAEATARRAALLPLDHAARRGLVASCAYPWER
jgi:hypothetical protein